jgi:hypothetical protein
MHFWRRSKRKQKFIENIEWMYWDDAEYPGLIRFDSFERLCQVVFGGRFGQYALASHTARIVPRSRATEHKLLDYYDELDEYLTAERKKDPKLILCYMDAAWSRPSNPPSLNVVRAHINILEHWGYRYAWKNILDARDTREGIVLSVEDVPTHAIFEHDLWHIDGYPSNFGIVVVGVGSREQRIPSGVFSFIRGGKLSYRPHIIGEYEDRPIGG